MNTSALAALTVLVVLGGGCGSAPANVPDATVLGTWRSASGPEQFIEVDRFRIRVLEQDVYGGCYLAFEYPVREGDTGAAGEIGNVYEAAGLTWTLTSEGGLLVAERRGPEETSTRTYERRSGWNGTACR